MNVTRDVIYDLLPSYFAGDASADTRVLVDEFFARDPEFGRMAERFGKLAARPSNAANENERAKVVFDEVRSRVKLRMAAAIWAGAALFAVLMGTVFTGGFTFKHPGMVIGAVFGAMALGTWLTSFSSRPDVWAGALEEDE
jgi:predicted anti-sigma-YlaC factor YlaD